MNLSKGSTVHRTGKHTWQQADIAALRRAGRRLLPEVLAGCVVGLFSVSEGMAFAAMGGFPPVDGLCAGIIPVALAALLAPRPFMVTTLTSAVALTSRTALERAHLSPADPRAVAALALTVGLVMAAAGLLGFGRLVTWIPRAALGGFSAAVALQILVGGIEHATGVHCPGRRADLNCLISLAAHPGRVALPDAGLAVFCVGVWAVVHAHPGSRFLALPTAIVAGTAAVAVTRLPVSLTAKLGEIPHTVPGPAVPLWAAIPSLGPGACIVAAAALAQAASISGTLPDGERPRIRGAVLAQAAANLAAACCHALPVGGSLSRTAVAASAGGRTRHTGLFAAVALAALVYLGGPWIARIPLPAMGVLLAIVGGELLAARLAEARAFARTSPAAFALFAGVFTLGALGPLVTALALSIGIGLVLRAPAAARTALERQDAAGNSPSTNSLRNLPR
jgi:SulP family sulfate permease